ncbi:hypothetical protein FO519_003130 [Halicephalobus sp. NKZ332]|nr:hypothetical protein FO519_003130 [Halicephalobus sp. NKZ332]
MNTKVVVFLLICLLYTAQADGPFCALCTSIIGGVIKQHNGDFSNVSADQLEKDLDAQCDAQVTNQFEDALCKQIAGQGKYKDDLLNALKAGKSAQQCCAEGGAC